MGKNKEEQLAIQEIREVKNLAKHNKRNVMFKKVRIELDGFQYELIIRGVGNHAIKLELYLDYETILNNKDKGTIEKILWEKLNRVYTKEAPQTIGDRRVI